MSDLKSTQSGRLLDIDNVKERKMYISMVGLFPKLVSSGFFIETKNLCVQAPTEFYNTK